MSQTTNLKLDDIDYPESDGAPRIESDPTQDYLRGLSVEQVAEALGLSIELVNQVLE